ncbi:hypothetical protein DPQ33_02310 [Oceanidesulfovibrio indonesiensis]|uniref:Outer membrane lipoprotein carrier protein LolA n=1 Tax=Oceanidesulfovibrio indonesiensis TaxID=54767 RepID=A0A7M3MHP3_9BACT|nr:outer membrane lipoprotein carrier protein LolA [Oceanidesulfovibrio indonesiensis]TVM19214.1 hypothetical protein DPQ33_02310 [Oceanidesulfovibrio indonesiensis]
MSIRHHLFASLLLICLMAFVAGSASANELDDAERDAFLQRLQTAQQDIRTVQARFTETRTISTLPRPLVFTGTLYVQRGDSLIFLRYEKPTQHILRVQEGEVLFWVQDSPTADVMQMDDTSASGQAGSNPNLFDWRPQDFSGAISREDDGYHLVSAGGENGPQRIEVVLDPEGLYATSIRITPKGGGATVIELHDVRINEPLPDVVIDFTLPAGTEINEMNRP